MDALFARLEHEHRTIRETLAAFERYLDLAQGGDARAHAADLPRFLVLFREYLDLVHHEREERVLLPAYPRAWTKRGVASTRPGVRHLVASYCPCCRRGRDRTGARSVTCFSENAPLSTSYNFAIGVRVV